jgi:hypothetical protein
MCILPTNNDGTLASYAWPGGYHIFYLDRENSVLCPDCANNSHQDPDEVPKFKPIVADINYEDPTLYCDHCGNRIGSAYDDEDVK